MSLLPRLDTAESCSIDERIASRVLRAELVGICAEIADADTERSADEQRVLDLVSQRFAPSS